MGDVLLYGRRLGSRPLALVLATSANVALAQTPVTPFPAAAPAASTDNGALRPVPNVSGMPANQAEDRLGAEGFTANRVSVPNGDYPPGYVVGQSPCAGCLATGGSAVTLQVGTGKAAVRVPSVLGLSDADVTHIRAIYARE